MWRASMACHRFVSMGLMIKRRENEWVMEHARKEA
jgi:hypothetical protein